MKNIKKYYRVFISSTFVDLVEERYRVAKTLYSVNCLPIGMEISRDNSQNTWEIIKNLIDESDFYILIIGSRYGSMDPKENISYTEKEYEYARYCNKPILAYVKKDIVHDQSEDDVKREKLKIFRQKLSTNLIINYWENFSDLIQYLAIDLFNILPRLNSFMLDQNQISNNNEIKSSKKSIIKLRVFINHASDDKKDARDIYKKLVLEEWIEPWLDEEKLLPGQNWKLEITKSVEQADVVIVCLSSKSTVKSGFVQKELQLALDIQSQKPEGQIYLLPIRLEECEIPKSLSSWHYVDYFPEEYKERSFSKILEALRIKLNTMKKEIY